MFTQENTDYTNEEITALNEEFKERFESGEWPTDDEETAFKWFADEVAKR
jgi:hypothetical protein